MTSKKFVSKTARDKLVIKKYFSSMQVFMTNKQRNF